MQKTSDAMQAPVVERDEDIDRLRGLSIVLVVVGHGIQFANGEAYLQSASFFENRAFKLIYGLHMPLFMLISGYLFSRAIDARSPGALLASRVRTLLVPIFAWGAIDLSIRLVGGQIATGSGLSGLLRHYLAICYELWLLWAAFFNALLAIVVCKFMRNSRVVYVGIGMALFFTPDAGNAHLYKYMWPFFFLPSWWKDAVGSDRRELGSRWPVAWIGIAAAVVYVSLMLSFWGRDDYIYTTGVSLLGKQPLHQLGVDALRWGLGILGCFAIVSIVRSVPRMTGAGPSPDLLVTLGQRSLGIYLVSGLAFGHLVPALTRDANFSWARVTITSALVTAGCAAATAGIARVALLDRVLLGGRKRALDTQRR